MKITIYELLGLIKDGKAPKKIKYSGIEYNLIEGNYVNEFGVNILQHLTYAEYIMTHKVEIIEEDKDIEKLNAKYTSQIGKLELANKIDELIDEVNRLKNKR